jgi:hypothetical protein
LDVKSYNVESVAQALSTFLINPANIFAISSKFLLKVSHFSTSIKFDILGQQYAHIDYFARLWQIRNDNRQSLMEERTRRGDPTTTKRLLRPDKSGLAMTEWALCKMLIKTFNSHPHPSLGF